MNKKISALLISAVLISLIVFPGMGLADTLPVKDPGWKVSFTADSTMESNFESGVIDETISKMQPGDDAVFSITLNNANSETTDWYMENKILYSLEDRSANKKTSGGAYGYRLVYVSSDGKEKVLFDSDSVGGDLKNEAGDEGLHKVSGGMDKWFYLTRLEKDQSGKIELRVSLEGETQGNNYQDTLADLEMRFGVQLPQDEGTDKIAKTGDETDLTVYIIPAVIAAAAIVLVVMLSRKRRDGRGEA